MLLLCVSFVTVACFVTFQYRRERLFKAEKLDARLQLCNMQILQALKRGEDPEWIDAGAYCIPDMRLTVIDGTGRIAFDTSADTLTENHLDRPEIVQALAEGHGYTIRRHSHTTQRDYFYSATADGGWVVRTAIPYSVTLREVLAADRHFLWFMLCVMLLISISGYFATRRLGHNITRLNRFAERAEHAENIEDEATFPHDELGDISNHIVRLYARLQKTMADRDREHMAALHEEQEKIRIKRQLTNNISHELKTPVAAILGYIETLLEHPEMDAEQRRAFLEKCLRHGERLRRLLEDVSSVIRMDEGARMIRKEKVVLNNFIEEITEEMALRPPERRLEIHCDFPAGMEMEGNPALLGSIFHNLAENASAYSGGTDIFISLAENTPERYTIVFADNGTGVGEEHLPHLFERFYRIDKGRSRKMGGTGLGLSIVKHAVMAHGGSVSVRNRAEGGLEFRFSLDRRSGL